MKQSWSFSFRDVFSEFLAAHAHSMARGAVCSPKCVLGRFESALA
jgi:hypothetical protein